MDDVFLPGVTDLFGDPVPRSRGKRGQPPHVPTAENRRFVQLALACGRDEEEVAAGLRISVKTLQRHYFHELAGKRSARMRLDMKNMAALVAQVESGNVSAMSILDRKLERLRREDAMRGASPRAAKPKPLGKKEAAIVAAHRAGRDSEWEGLIN